MSIESQQDLDALFRVGRIVGLILQEMQAAVKPGQTTAELDAFGAQLMEKHGVRSAPMVMYKFPGATCISLNDEAAHGIPGQRVIQEGDLVNVDVSCELDGYFADTGGTIAVPPVAPEHQRLMDCTRQALEAALEAVSADKPINVIGKAVESVSKPCKLNIIRQLGGHGVGRSLHEEPRNVPNYFTKRARQKLQSGMVLTIEPFLTPGAGRIYTADDGWTLKTESGLPACQYEHTVVITREKPILLTAV